MSECIDILQYKNQVEPGVKAIPLNLLFLPFLLLIFSYFSYFSNFSYFTYFTYFTYFSYFSYFPTFQFSYFSYFSWSGLVWSGLVRDLEWDKAVIPEQYLEWDKAVITLILLLLLLLQSFFDLHCYRGLPSG